MITYWWKSKHSLGTVVWNAKLYSEPPKKLSETTIQIWLRSSGRYSDVVSDPCTPPPPPPHPSLPPLALTCVPITSLPFANETDLALLWKVFQCCKGSCPGAPPPALQTPSPCCLSPADQSNPPFLVVVVNNGCACQACHSLDLHLLHTCCPR